MSDTVRNVGESRAIRKFETGATRNSDTGKPDYDGFLSPEVVVAFGEYMHKHRYQADGTLRDSDNWKKGMSLPVYIKSLWRHFVDLWRLHRGHTVTDTEGKNVTVKDAACAILFNTQGYLHEFLKPETGGKSQYDGDWNWPTQPPGFWRVQGTTVIFIADFGVTTLSRPFKDVKEAIDSGRWVRNTWGK